MYISTRGGSAPVSASAAIYKGLAEDGGLFVPEKIQPFPDELWAELPQMPYRELAREIFRLYLDDFSEEEIELLFRLYAKLYLGMEQFGQYAEELSCKGKREKCIY